MIAVIGIGSELLTGNTVNTNASFISSLLYKEGFAVSHHFVVGDSPIELKKMLKGAFKNHQVVITTGGLGPTCDDLTRQVIAEYVGSGFCFHQKVAEHLKKRYGNELISLEDQATVPEKAEVFLNNVGTASGLAFQLEPLERREEEKAQKNKEEQVKKEKQCLIVLPGVPLEMEQMMLSSVVPYLKKQFFCDFVNVVEGLHFLRLKESSIDPTLRKLQELYPNVSIGIYPNTGYLTVRASCRAKTEEDGKRELQPLVDSLLKEFKSHYLGKETEFNSLEEGLQVLYQQEKYTLATAESCTGGGIASCLTKLPGISDLFLGGIVCYSNQVKHQVLKVKNSTLQEHGAVSEETVKEMLQGVLEVVGSDWAVATSGIAGPGGGTPSKPVGTVIAGVQKRGEEPYIWTMHIKGNRKKNIASSIHQVLGVLLLQIKVRTKKQL